MTVIQASSGSVLEAPKILAEQRKPIKQEVGTKPSGSPIETPVFQPPITPPLNFSMIPIASKKSAMKESDRLFREILDKAGLDGKSLAQDFRMQTPISYSSILNPKVQIKPEGFIPYQHPYNPKHQIASLLAGVAIASGVSAAATLSVGVGLPLINGMKQAPISNKDLLNLAIADKNSGTPEALSLSQLEKLNYIKSHLTPEQLVALNNLKSLTDVFDETQFHLLSDLIAAQADLESLASATKGSLTSLDTLLANLNSSSLTQVQLHTLSELAKTMTSADIQAAFASTTAPTSLSTIGLTTAQFDALHNLFANLDAPTVQNLLTHENLNLISNLAHTLTASEFHGLLTADSNFLLSIFNLSATELKVLLNIDDAKVAQLQTILANISGKDVSQLQTVLKDTPFSNAFAIDALLNSSQTSSLASIVSDTTANQLTALHAGVQYTAANFDSLITAVQGANLTSAQVSELATIANNSANDLTALFKTAADATSINALITGTANDLTTAQFDALKNLFVNLDAATIKSVLSSSAISDTASLKTILTNMLLTAVSASTLTSTQVTELAAIAASRTASELQAFFTAADKTSINDLIGGVATANDLTDAQFAALKNLFAGLDAESIKTILATSSIANTDTLKNILSVINVDALLTAVNGSALTTDQITALADIANSPANDLVALFKTAADATSVNALITGTANDLTTAQFNALHALFANLDATVIKDLLATQNLAVLGKLADVLSATQLDGVIHAGANALDQILSLPAADLQSLLGLSPAEADQLLALKDHLTPQDLASLKSILATGGDTSLVDALKALELMNPLTIVSDIFSSAATIVGLVSLGVMLTSGACSFGKWLYDKHQISKAKEAFENDFELDHTKYNELQGKLSYAISELKKIPDEIFKDDDVSKKKLIDGFQRIKAYFHGLTLKMYLEPNSITVDESKTLAYFLGGTKPVTSKLIFLQLEKSHLPITQEDKENLKKLVDGATEKGLASIEKAVDRLCDKHAVLTTNDLSVLRLAINGNLLNWRLNGNKHYLMDYKANEKKFTENRRAELLAKV
ncbi:MAG: hypothetical protein WC860_03225 [Candidatus Margulisiibacteriota bacterium]|jgi:hypothetical protein